MWLPFLSGPLSREDGPPLPSPANGPVWGEEETSPQFHSCTFSTSGNTFASLLSLFVAPSSVLGWSPRCQSIRKRVARAVLTAIKGLLASVQAPFPGRLSPASEDSLKVTHLLRKSVENGIFLGSECGCHMTAPPRRPLPGYPGPFFHPPPRREPELTRVDEELIRLPGLSPSW